MQPGEGMLVLTVPGAMRLSGISIDWSKNPDYEARILSEAQRLVREYSAPRRDLSITLLKFKQFWTFFIKCNFFKNEVDFYDFFQIKISADEMRSNLCYEMVIE